MVCLLSLVVRLSGWSLVQYTTVHYNTLMHHAPLYTTLLYITIHYSTVDYSTLQYTTPRYTALLYITIVALHQITLHCTILDLSQQSSTEVPNRCWHRMFAMTGQAVTVWLNVRLNWTMTGQRMTIWLHPVNHCCANWPAVHSTLPFSTSLCNNCHSVVDCMCFSWNNSTVLTAYYIVKCTERSSLLIERPSLRTERLSLRTERSSLKLKDLVYGLKVRPTWHTVIYATHRLKVNSKSVVTDLTSGLKVNSNVHVNNSSVKLTELITVQMAWLTEQPRSTCKLVCRDWCNAWTESEWQNCRYWSKLTLGLKLKSKVTYMWTTQVWTEARLT